jgi:NAD-dependent SIR2 family protein deacetylase
MLQRLVSKGRVQRIYSQNIDGLEAAAGLEVFPLTTSTVSQGGVIALHGSIRHLTPAPALCSHSGYRVPTATDDEVLATGNSPKCPDCLSVPSRRRVGYLQHAVLCDDEASPIVEELAKATIDDQRCLDLLVVVGTSLKPDRIGPTNVVKTLLPDQSSQCLFINPYAKSLPLVLKGKAELIGLDCQALAEAILKRLPETL